MMIEKDDDGVCSAGAVGAAVDSERETFAAAIALFVLGECRALIVAPWQVLLVEPNEHRCGAGYDAKRVGKADLVVAFGKDGQIDADKLGREVLEHRSCGKHEMCRLE